MSRSNQLAGLLTADPPSALDTINEINTALGNDASLSTTLTNSIATKAPLASPTFTGDAVFDTSTLKVDSTNNRIGIGTASPSSTLTVKGTLGLETTDSTNKWLAYAHTDDTLRLNYNGAGNDEVVIDSSGNVGIGTASPSCALHIYTPNSASTNYLVQRWGNSNSTHGYVDFQLVNPGSTASGFPRLDLEMGNSPIMSFVRGGNVGIGTTSPDSLTHLSTSTGSGPSHGPTLLLESFRTGQMPADTRIGRIAFKQGWTVGAYDIDRAYIDAVVDVDSVWVPGVALEFSTGPYTVAPTPRMRIKSNGRVGIGTDAPQQHLEVHDSGGLAYLLINGGGGDGTTTSALQLGGRSASGGNALAQVSAIRIGDTRGQLIFSTKSSANTLTQRGGFYHGGRSEAREQAFAIQNRRIIYNWYDVTGTSNTYKHIKTSLWMGGTHSNGYGYNGNQYYWMGGWRFYGYRYTSSNAIADTSFFFHNWSGGFSHPEIQNNGGWHILDGYYTSSDGFCCLRLLGDNYASVHMDMFQVFGSYPFRDVIVFSTTNTNSSGAQF